MMIFSKRVIHNDPEKRGPKNRWAQYVGETDTHYLAVVVYAQGGTGYLVYALPKTTHTIALEKDESNDDLL